MDIFENMKNLMIYINPSHDFDEETRVLVKIQIDNSLRLGFKLKDILLVTNFPYEYKKVKALLVHDNNYCTVHNKASKINVIITLFENGTINDKDLYWFHDFDAFQTKRFAKDQPGLGGTYVGFTDYGLMPKWNTGSIFFRYGSQKVFEWLRNEVYRLQTDEERALTSLTDRNYKNINDRYVRLNVTYNFPSCKSWIKRIPKNYELSIKPIQVLHFHPFYRGINYLEKLNKDNPLNKNFIPKGLCDIFKTHLPALSQNI